MSRIEFYILKPTYKTDFYKFTCHLLEKAYSQGHRAYIHAASAEEANHLNKLLWVFRDGSFVPHDLVGDANDYALTPILLGSGDNEDTGGITDVLVNLAPKVPEFFHLFQRVVEILDQDQERLRLGRERFRYYRDAGHLPITHDMV